MLLYATLLLCAMLAAVMVYRYDLHDREAWSMALLAVVMGAIGMFLAGRVQVGVLSAMGNVAASNWNTSISLAAGITEEAAKLSVVLCIAFALPRAFNDPLDGIVYGSFAGLGAALEETVALLGVTRPWEMLPPQEVVRIAGHLVMGGIGGFGVGMLRPSRRRYRALVLPGAFLAAIALHVLWDIVAFDALDKGRMERWHTLAAVALMFSGLLAYWRLVVTGERWSRAWFGRNEEPRGLGPAAS